MKHEQPPTTKEIQMFMAQFQLKQRQMASCAGVTVRAMQYYLAGERTMTLQTWEYLRRNVHKRQIMLHQKQIKEI